MLPRRSFACATVALLTLVTAVWIPAPVAAPVAPVSAPAGAADAPSPIFRADGAHLAPGVTLRLAALGRGDTLTPVDTVNPTDDGTRATYPHGAVTEWYLRAGEQGGQGGRIEQGVTLASPPIGEGPLTLTIATPDLIARVNDAGDAATLLVPHASGTNEQWRYDGLRVTDATGRVLPSHLTPAAGGGIGITADDAGAVYPVTIDPLVQLQTLVVAGAGFFGYALALSADSSTAIVGAYGTTVGGVTNAGTAYVYKRGAGGFTPFGSTLAVSGTGLFGVAVALSADGGTALIGAYGTTVGGVTNAGTAYVFTRGMGGYTQFGLTLAVTGASLFGSAVALSSDGTTALVGAPGTNMIAGTAYVFTRNGMSYAQAGSTLTASGAQFFGYAVALSSDGTTALIGAPGTDGRVGAAYVFTQSAGVFTLFGLPLTAQATGNFGIAVALSGEGTTALVGADTTNMGAGAAYVFRRGSMGFTLGQTLTVTGTSGFGNTVALSADGNTALSGAPFTNSNAGAVYEFRQSGADYAPFGSPLTASGANEFGFPVTLSGDGNTALIGAPLTNGNAGIAYVFTNAVLTGFSPPTGPTAGGTNVTVRGVNLTAVTVVSFGGVLGTNVFVSTDGTSLTVTAPAHAAGTVDIAVTANGQTATIHGYTYLDAGSIAPQPTPHATATGGGGMPMAQPTRHSTPTGTPMSTPMAQPGRR